MRKQLKRATLLISVFAFILLACGCNRFSDVTNIGDSALRQETSSHDGEQSDETDREYGTQPETAEQQEKDMQPETAEQQEKDMQLETTGQPDTGVQPESDIQQNTAYETTADIAAESGTADETVQNEYEYKETNDTVYALAGLNVRASESTDAEILGVLQYGEAVSRTGINDEWTRIIYAGQTAYVSSAYISEMQPTEAASTVPVISLEGTGIFYDNGGYLVAIDAGHQAVGNSEQEPVGPGAAETKAKVSSGTQGVVTGIAEHEMNLAISLYLRDELLARGYSVLMIRETADVNISNAERAELANSYNADIFVRVHGNSVSNQEVNGALTMCMTKNNPYNGNLYNPSRVLSEKILEGLCAATGAVNKGIQETDAMSGINWCSVPVTIVEVGFMSNPEEDKTMAEDSYRQTMAKGIADGIDAYFGR